MINSQAKAYIENADGTFHETKDYFIFEKYKIGLIVGAFWGVILTFCFMLIFCLQVIKQINADNYLIPKTKALGLYIQLENGKLYRRQ